MDDKRRLILDQALALVDERGLAAMSMRAVAERVGLTSMALYPYVGGKDALLDGLVDLLHLELGTEYGTDPADIDWRQRLRALGRAVRGLSLRHPGAYPLLLNRPSAGGSWLTAALRATLHDAGVPGEQVPRLTRMICAFLLGYTTGEVTGGLPPGAAQTAGPASFLDPRRPDPGTADEHHAAPGHAAPSDVSSSQAPSDQADPGAANPGAADPGAANPGDAELREGEADAADAGRAGGRDRPGAAGDAEFDADLEDLVRLVEVTVRVT